MSQETSRRQHEAVIEAEFSVQSTAYPFVNATRTGECVFELAKMVPRTDERYSEFFNVIGAEPDSILAGAADAVTDATVLREYRNGGLVEFVVSDDCPAVTLADLGALPREITGAEGEGRIVAEITPEYDSASVIGRFLDETPGVELVSKRPKESVTPLFTESAFEQVLDSRLTDRQREVLEAAFEGGYYEWPRECTGEEIAEDLDITSSTVSEHIHAAERKLLATVFGGQ